MDHFNRRLYRTFSEFAGDVWRILALRGAIKPLMRGESLDPAFRERLFLAVTAVNRCRYCANYHARIAFQNGISKEEIVLLDDKVLAGSPEDQLPALLYAQTWAESAGQSTPELDERLLRTYGDEQAQAIRLSLLIIRTANLIGNTWDYVLYRLSSGRSIPVRSSDTRE